MLIPAVRYKNEIEQYSDELRYSTQMMYFNGCTETGRMHIETEPTEGKYQWAIVDRDKQLVGYVGYQVDYFSSSIYGFGLISFIENKRAMASGILQVIKHIQKLSPHRIEWRCVEDNTAFLGYKKITERMVKEYQCNVSILHDLFKDAYGAYHNCAIFELLKRNSSQELKDEK